jgi:uncharacterized lipoprotein
MKFYNKKMLIFSMVLLTACSSYQRHFGGKSGNYENANTTDSLEYPSGMASLPASDRYEVPEVQASEKNITITPPDYQD